MQQQERDLIGGLFGRLEQFENQPRDPEAEHLIADFVSRQPSAVYLLTQTAIVQEEALKQAKARIAELESKATGTSFLGSAPKIGPWGSAPSAPQAPAPRSPWQTAPAAPQAASYPPQAAPYPPQAAPYPQQAAPYSQQAPMGASAGTGGGFLRTALTTAAGVAGGALLFQGISSMFGHSTSQAFASPALNPSSLLPPDQLPSSDYGQDLANAGNYDSTSGNYNSTSDNYDSTPDNSGFDDSGSDDSGSDDSSFDNSSDDDNI
jgi:hypothetical protein